MAVYQAFQAIGQREDLVDVIVNISPTETPCFSAFKKVKASGILHEWQTDSLAAAAENVQIEGADLASASDFPTLGVTTRLGNRCQISSKAFLVSHTLEAVSKAGRDSEYAYQAEKAMKELGRDTEFDLIRNTSAAGNATTARQMTGIDVSLATNVNSTGGDLLEGLYNDMLQTIFASGGNPNVTLCNGFQKRQISAFSGPSGASKNIALSDRRLINSVDVYESDFGLQKMILDRHVPTDEIYLLEMAMSRVAILRPTKHFPLPDIGGGPRGKVEHELTYEYGNEASGGKIDGLTTS